MQGQDVWTPNDSLKLKKMLEEWDRGKLKFSPTCPRSTYNMQLTAMADYLAVLEARAVMEDIELKEVQEI